MSNLFVSYVKAQFSRLEGSDGKVEFHYKPAMQVRSVHGKTNWMDVDEQCFEEIRQALLRQADRQHNQNTNVGEVK